MIPVVFRPSAEADLIAIAIHIAEHNPDAARKMVARLRERCLALGQRPELGRPRPEFGDDIRSLWQKPYAVLYRPLAAEVEILAIVHGARDLPAVIAARLATEG